MNQAILLDRDGVVIKERGAYSYLPEHVEMVPGIFDALKFFQDQGYWLFIVTNQGGVAKGLYGHEDVQNIEAIIEQQLALYQVEIKDYFYCPHHDLYGRCMCRKPDSLMLEKAIAKYDLDPNKSWYIGDMDTDVIAGRQAGLNALAIQPNADLSGYLDQILSVRK